MRRIGYAALAACALALAACSTGYGRMSLLGGYSDKQIEPGLWRVSATTNGYSGESSAFDMALYRAAEIARDAGFPYFQVVRSDFGVLPVIAGNTMSFSGGGQNARLRIRGAREANAPLACEVEASACRAYSVEEVLRALGPVVNPRGQARPPGA